MSAERLPWEAIAPGRRLFLDHLRGEGAARALLGGRGIDDAAVAAAAEERRRLPLPGREGMAEAVASWLASRGAPPEALGSAARLADPRSVAVVGGQQPGVGGGPLLAFAKAIGVLSLASRLEATGAGPVVPIWWVASEDHDADEAAAVRLAPGKDARDLPGAAGPGPGPRTMLSRRPAPAAADVLALLGGGEHAAWVAGLLPGGGDLGSHATAVFLRLLGPAGLAVVEPQVLRPFARPVFEKDVREPGVLAAAVREGNARAARSGYGRVLEDPASVLHFRVDDRGERSRVPGRPEDLDSLADRLSADVALRVLAQDQALPVAAQVCGPSETEYLAALLPAREAAGVFAPCAVPRPGVTLLERRVEEALAGFGTDLAGLYRLGPSALARPAGVESPLAAEARRLRGELDRAAGDAAALPAAVRSRLGRVQDGLEELAAAAERAEGESRGVGEARRRKVLEALLPAGSPQERRWSLLPFLLRHGPALWERMVAELSGPEAGHRVIRV